MEWRAPGENRVWGMLPGLFAIALGVSVLADLGSPPPTAGVVFGAVLVVLCPILLYRAVRRGVSIDDQTVTVRGIFWSRSFPRRQLVGATQTSGGHGLIWTNSQAQKCDVRVSAFSTTRRLPKTILAVDRAERAINKLATARRLIDGQEASTTSSREDQGGHEVQIVRVHESKAPTFDPFLSPRCVCGWIGKGGDVSPEGTQAVMAEARTHTDRIKPDVLDLPL